MRWERRRPVERGRGEEDEGERGGREEDGRAWPGEEEEGRRAAGRRRGGGTAGRRGRPGGEEAQPDGGREAGARRFRSETKETKKEMVLDT